MDSKAKKGAKKAGQIARRTIGDVSDEILEIPKSVPKQALGLPEERSSDKNKQSESAPAKTKEEKPFMQQLTEALGLKDSANGSTDSTQADEQGKKKLNYLDEELDKLKKQEELRKEQERILEEQQKAAQPIPEKALQVPSSVRSRKMGAGKKGKQTPGKREQQKKQGTRESGDIRRSG